LFCPAAGLITAMTKYILTLSHLMIISLFLSNILEAADAQILPAEAMSFASKAFSNENHAVGEPLQLIENQTNSRSIFLIQQYPADPGADIPWSCGTINVVDIECAFNSARNSENNQLGTSIPMLSLPDQGAWDEMGDGERAIWLINRERIDRGIDPLHGLETNVMGVAQSYAQYLMDHSAFGHDADGRTPWERLSANPTIGACHDFLSVAENLAIFWTSGSSIALPVERSIYMWMYDDGGSFWGHRHAILWYPYNDNSGPSGKEGFLGIGRASGPHDGWNYAELIVMNVFDPCAAWDYQTLLADFTGTPTTGTVPLTVTFSDQSTGDISSYFWDFGDQSSSTEPNPIHSYTSSGTFSVTLTVSGPEGSDSKTKVNFVQVNSAQKKGLPWIQLLLLEE
jgi:hypothetical protein